MPIKGQTFYIKVFIGKTEISSTCVRVLTRKIQYFLYFLMHFYPIKLLQFEGTREELYMYIMGIVCIGIVKHDVGIAKHEM